MSDKKTVKKEIEVSWPKDTAPEIGSELMLVATELKKANSPKRRFFLGIIFGVGTALGASVIAGVLVLLMARLLAPIGIDFMSDLNEIQSALENVQQLESVQD